MRGIPSTWRAGRISDVSAKPQYGWTSSAKQDAGGLPLLRTTDISRGPIDWSVVPRCVTSPPDPSRFMLKRNDIVVSRAGSVGLSALITDPPPSVFASYLMRLRPTNDVLPRFLALFMNSPDYWSQIAEVTNGIALQNINATKLAAVELPLPPLDEQGRIVDILEDHLSRLDAAIGGLRLALRRAAVLERSVIDDVFMRRADDEDWPVVRLEELAATELRSMTDGPFGSNLARAHYTVSGARVVRLQNIGDGEYRAADAFISLDHYDTLRSHNVRAGDVVVASLGELLPRAAVVPDLGGPAIVKADCIRIRPQAGIDPAWIALACRSSRTKRWAEARVHGVGRQRLGMKGIRDIPIPFPNDPPTRDQAIAAMASDFEGLRSLRASIDSAQSRGETLRRSLLAAAFSGRLTGQTTDIEMVEEMASV